MSAEAERGAVVAWLRGAASDAGGYGDKKLGTDERRRAAMLYFGQEMLSHAADTIEGGAHLSDHRGGE